MPKGYPRSRFELVRQESQKEVVARVSETGFIPLAMAAYTSDKGSEEWKVYSDLEDFVKETGPLSYNKHGQAQLTVAMELQAGARVLCKRMVSEDAILPNVTVRARVVKVKDTDKDPVSYVYYYVISSSTAKTFEEACEYGYNPSASELTIDTSATSKYVDFPLFTVAAKGRGASNLKFALVPQYRNNKLNATKAASISTSKISDTPITYNFVVYENNKELESISFCMNPDAMFNGTAMSMNPRLRQLAKQVDVRAYEDDFYRFISALAETATIEVNKEQTVIDVDNLINIDYLNGRYYDRSLISGIVSGPGIDIVDADGEDADKVDNWELHREDAAVVRPVFDSEDETQVNDQSSNLAVYAAYTSDSGTVFYTLDNSNDTGTFPLLNGSYGTMTNVPMAKSTAIVTTDDNGVETVKPSEYEKLLLNTFGLGTEDQEIIIDDSTDPATTKLVPSDLLFDPIIYDVDMYKPDFICDCNFPISVKKAISALADVRGDLMFLADLTTKVRNLNDIEAVVNELTDDNTQYSIFTALYHNWFKIYDGFSKKEITVTMPYLLIPKIVSYLTSRISTPFCGIVNNMTFPEIIYGTLNFRPINIPNDIDQKQALVDINVNYISYYDGVPVMETEYTNCEGYDQFSFINNILAVQEVIKAIRTRCPKMRYTFLNSADLQHYIDDATNVINQYSNNFESINMQYMANAAYEANKIFYATIKVIFKNFIQEEYFRVIAID